MTRSCPCILHKLNSDFIICVNTTLCVTLLCSS